jgi:phosphate transport system permease protein
MNNVKNILKKLFKAEQIAKAIFFLLATLSVVVVFAIIIFLLYVSIPAFRQVGIINFLFGGVWSPKTGKYGIAKMIVGTFALTGCALLLGGTLAIFCAVWVVYYCPTKFKGIYTQIINLLAGIPSIVYGLFGYKFLMPLLVKIFKPANAGFGLLASTIILSIMILPTVASITKNSLQSLPLHYLEGSLALGSTKNQTIFKVLLPASRGGIFSALILGIGRAVGETMAVQMIVGNGSGYPLGAFVPFTTLTTNIVQNWGYAEVWNGDFNSPTQQNYLFACGTVLLAIILLLNILILFTNRKTSGNRFFTRQFKEKEVTFERTLNYRQTGFFHNILSIISWLTATIIAVILFFIAGYIFVKGAKNISLHFVFGESGNGGITLVPAIIASLMLIFLSLAISLPIGIGGAIYLNEYSNKSGKLIKVIRLFIDTLAGIPSIIFGIFGYVLLVKSMKLGYSLTAGGITLALMVLPTIIRSTEQSLAEVPDSMREASYALGAGKLRTIFKVVLPRALSGIATAVILSVGRILSESAGLIFTVGTAGTFIPLGYGDTCASLAVLIWQFMSNGLNTNEAYATSAVLLAIIIAINLCLTFFNRGLKRTVK